MTGGKVKNGNNEKKDAKKSNGERRNALKGREPSLDYGNTYTTPAGTVDEEMRFYGGRCENSERRLLYGTLGISNETLLKAFLDSCSDEHVLKFGQSIEVGGYKLTYEGFVNKFRKVVIEIKNRKTGKKTHATVCQGLETPVVWPDGKGILITVSECSRREVSLTIKEK